jgi:hypothetical protein
MQGRPERGTGSPGRVRADASIARAATANGPLLLDWT